MVADAKSMIVCSAPVDASLFGSCLDYASRVSGMQALLGYEAQIRAFAKVLGLASVRAFIAAAPEIFYAKPSFKAIEDLAEKHGRRLSDVVHVRFGPPRQSRVLRGVKNIYVCSESAPGTCGFESRNPYAANKLLPAAFDRVVTWCGEGAPLNIAGRRMASHVLLADLVSADLEPSTGAVGIADTYVGKPNSLLVQSFFEFNPDTWRPSSGTDHRPSTEFSRLLVAWDGASSNRMAPRPIILLPWNLANPASIVPDVVAKIASFDILRHVNQAMLVYPYNVNTSNHRLIVDLVGHIRNLSGGRRPVLDKIFVARASGAYGIDVLRDVVQIALLEVSDPEWMWTNQRLAGLGLGTALLAEPNFETDQEISLAVDSDQPLHMRVHDEFGERYYRTFSPAPVALAEFFRVACSRPPWRRSPPPLQARNTAVGALVKFIAGSSP